MTEYQVTATAHGFRYCISTGLDTGTNTRSVNTENVLMCRGRRNVSDIAPYYIRSNFDFEICKYVKTHKYIDTYIYLLNICIYICQNRIYIYKYIVLYLYLLVTHTVTAITLALVTINGRAGGEVVGTQDTAKGQKGSCTY